MLNSWKYSYKRLPQNCLFDFNWSFGRKNTQISIFLKLVDYETVMKKVLFPMTKYSLIWMQV